MKNYSIYCTVNLNIFWECKCHLSLTFSAVDCIVARTAMNWPRPGPFLRAVAALEEFAIIYCRFF